jgi:plasmid replication initiation protein
MRKLLTSFFEKLADKTRKKEPQVAVIEEIREVETSPPQSKKVSKNKIPKEKKEIIPVRERSLRDFSEMMEVPFLALSKNRKNPITYESADGEIKIKVSRHTEHFVASIYDWDIILFVAGKMQEILNEAKDIPPRTMVFPRHELLKTIHKHNVNTQQKRLEDSLHRLRRTAIDTTIRNKDYRYKADFGFIDSWDYTDRKDVKEIRITLSQWLYDGICRQGSLLKINSDYFSLTSGLKKFLYRTARKHAGNNGEGWEFAIEKLYEKSGSEREFKKFKSDLKIAVLEDDIPEYSMEWLEKKGKTLVYFKKSGVYELDKLIEKIDGIQESKKFNGSGEIAEQ